MPSVAGRFALVKMSGDPVAMTDEPMSTTDNQYYQTVNTLKTVWDPTATFVVEESGVTTVDAYTLNRLTGQVIFAAADGGRGPITVTGFYRPLSVVAKVKSYTHTLEAPALDDTTFDSPGWRENIPNIIDFRATFNRNVQSADFTFLDAIAAGEMALLEFWDDRRTNFGLRAWGFFVKDGANASTDSIVNADVEFRATQDVDRRVAAVTKSEPTTPVYLFPTSIVFEEDPYAETLTVASPTVTPTPHVLDQLGATLTGDPAPTTWTTSNAAVATVNTGSGLITRVANGVCNIYAWYGSVRSPAFRITCTA